MRTHELAKSPEALQPCFVAVHVGAGYHSVNQESAYLHALRNACQATASASNCLIGVQQAIQALEMNEITNAGLGSNLTLDGTVEADASIMLGDRTFAAVGAVPGLESAIGAAAHLAEETWQPLSLGRVRPMFLAGTKAWEWARSRGLSTAPSLADADKWHVTPSALKQWSKYKTMINEDAAKHQRQLQQQQQRQQNSNESAGNQSHSSADATVVIRQHAGEPSATKRPAASNSADHSQYAEPKTKRQHLGVESSGSDAEQNTPQLPQRSIENLSSSSIPQAEDVSDMNDTVGAIFVDAAGHVGAGVSSGGIVMKMPGRVGEAAMYACGCWAVDPVLDRPGVACSVSGVGEVIMRACLAKECCQRMLNMDLSVDEACSQVIQETIMHETPPHDCGVLAVRVVIKVDANSISHQVGVECAAVNYSRSMGVAWSMLHTASAPQCHMLRLGHAHHQGALGVVGMGCFRTWQLLKTAA